MRRIVRSFAFVAAFALAAVGMASVGGVETADAGKPPKRGTEPDAEFRRGGCVRARVATRTRVTFERNDASAAGRAFLARCRGFHARIGAGGAVFRTTRDETRLEFVGASPDARLLEADELPTRSHYLVGADPSRWVVGVPHFARLVQRGVWPGIDVVWRDGGGTLAYDLVVAPGADVGAIGLSFDGARACEVDSDGSLRIRTDGGEFVHSRPVLYQDGEDGRRNVEGGFTVLGDDRFGFRVDAHDPSLPLVIDPDVEFATYLGGAGTDQVHDVQVDSEGAVYVVGLTASTGFPVQSPLQSGHGGGGQDAFLSKVDPETGDLVFSTFLGGSGNDFAKCVAVDSNGVVYVGGETDSSDFPTQSAAQTSYGGHGADAFVAKVSADGASLSYSTYLGGNTWDTCSGIAVDASGAAYVSGTTQSTNFPTRNPIQSAVAGSGGYPDAFVAKLDASGALVYSTYLGGTNQETGCVAIAVDSSGSAYVAGTTTSTDFPTQSPLQSARQGGSDAFVAKLNASGSALVYSTYLGGSGFEFLGSGSGVGPGVGDAIALDGSGAVYVAGQSTSTDFATSGAAQTSPGGGNVDAFVAKIAASGASVAYVTYLGGSGADEGRGIAVNSSGAAFVTGVTASTDFPTVSASQGSHGGGQYDAFVAKVAPDGSSLEWSTFLGGSGSEEGRAVAIDASDAVLVGGVTGSSDLPTVGASQTTYAGSSDGFVVKFEGVGTAPGTAPTQLDAMLVGDISVALTWAYAGDDETAFEVQRMRVGGPWVAVGTAAADAMSWLDTRIAPSTTFVYRVRAMNDWGASAWSNEARVTTSAFVPPPPPPNAFTVPSQFALAVLTDGIRLTWKDDNPDEEYFQVSRRTGGADWVSYAVLPSGTTSFEDRGLTPGWPYAYRVRSLSLAGPSDYAGPVTYTPVATLALEVTKGTVATAPKPHRNKVRVESSYESAGSADAATLDPVAHGVELQLGPASDPFVVSIPQGDPGWKVRRSRLTWRSGKEVLPNVKVVLDTARRTLSVSVSRGDLGESGNPIRLLLGCGSEGGAASAAWEETRTGYRLR